MTTLRRRFITPVCALIAVSLGAAALGFAVADDATRAALCLLAGAVVAIVALVLEDR